MTKSKRGRFQGINEANQLLFIRRSAVRYVSLSENHPIMCAKLFVCVCVFGLFSPDYFELPLEMWSCQIKLNKSCQNRKKGERNGLKLEKNPKACDQWGFTDGNRIDGADLHMLLSINLL